MLSRSQAPRREEHADARDVRVRFLTAIAERIAPHRIAELHLFPPIRQGSLETGIAVIAAYPEARAADAADADAGEAGDGAAAAGESPAGAGPPPVYHDGVPARDEPHPIAAEASGLSHGDREGGGPRGRLTVYRATYRWVRKGAERGKWEVDVRAEADAPLETVEDIVRGVHRRAGGEAEPERLSAEAVRAAVSERPWTAPT